MAAPSPIIDLSSDEEDNLDALPVPLAPAQVSAKKGVRGLGSPGVEVGNVLFTENVSSPGLNKGKVRKVRGGKVGFGEDGASPRLSNWGEPLPPEPEVHTPVEISPRERGSVTDGSHIHNGNDVDRKVRLLTGVKVKSPSSPSLPPLPSDNSEVCRLFWRAGDYEAQPSRVRTSQGAMDHVRVHPKFLHSNATSHKWALGAVAELLDNAVDEVGNGATFVSVDKIINPRDNSPSLLVQDDGGGMTPDCMRQCMSLGYSRKNTNTTIGQYGNGFKTSTMRLGADVIVFSRCRNGSVVTQSIGLLSYTFLRKTGHEDVVVPMIDYELTERDGALRPAGDGLRKMVRTTLDDWHSNLTSILQWSPYSTEAEILSQFNDLGWHGTKVIVYNLWFNDDGVLELDFDSDEHDIQLRGGAKQDKGKPVQAQLAQQHIANRYHHSLRVYASILYLQMPPGFQIILRGQPVAHHSIANDLKFPEQIIYKPQIGNNKDQNKETSVITIIGFTKEAPLINVHGFNVYHKNRLIMPFWKVWQDNSSRGRGVVGVLEANFVEPAHDKQDFERTAVLLRLETRLKQMTVEYWNLHCHLIGYQPNTKAGKARKQAAAPPPIDYPAPIASITPAIPLATPPEPSNSADLPSPATGSRPTSSVPITTRSSVPNTEWKPEGPQVKPEPMDFTPDLSKRPSSASVSEALHRLKRQRVETAANNSHPTIPEEPQTAMADTNMSTQADESVLLHLVEENSQLLAKVADYEHHTRKLEQQAKELELRLNEEKERVVKLQQELERLKMSREPQPKQLVDARKDDGKKLTVDTGRIADTNHGVEAVVSGTIVPGGTSAPVTVPKVVVKVEQH
ncbi:MORC family CW-type zinc finger protein [Marchantia polymorpha subsp. ruderalis]|uniref:Morc S5 domain-containing protein n=4 Tax=Marchantia polymorpha TaxID=3197 RepID=A0AAF6AKD5_MARPO|nr:hypothetical protein MARPO_0029s0099 [Marchantia polymorpha]BBM96905.1 hypothetical protein Mp_1g01480 [Marchantia polymorpha subsp. ruderalis]PTQ42574.1 hypothetical protein MARPO_0029s0099 [Marchantia polymorpha]PTQ42575.1 hypothetical protein MARPO_0029s0099 [Marchantia polymorpha]BBM96906.1 hypothetical protein Mp_1g01480 [Marchantia polymorpha subsp. ruderalis]|eukprot:PTQ42573.1 hypothetical protein MARPO_0029s0099 [Marchantia polymorpha]